MLIKNNKKRETALKYEAGGDEKHLFFLLGLMILQYYQDMVGKCIGGISQPHGEEFIMWLTAKPLLLIHSQTMRRSRCMCRWINEESLPIEKIWV